MRATTGVLLAGLAGCFSPAYEYENAELACSAQMNCPEGYHCAQGGCWRDGSDPPPPVAVTVTTYEVGSLGPLRFFAYQDGDGPWQPAGRVGDAYRFDVFKGRYGITYTCQDGRRFVFATTGELTSFTAGCTAQPARGTLYGAATGLTGTQTAMVFFGDGVSTEQLTMSQGNWAVGSIKGTFDVVAVRSGDEVGATDGLFLARGVTLGSDSQLYAGINFANLQPLTFSPVTITGAVDGEFVYAQSTLITANRARGYMFGTNMWPALATAAQQPGDTHQVEAWARTDTSLRIAGRVTKAPAALEFTLPAPLESPLVEVVAFEPYVRMKVSFTSGSPAPALYQLSLTQFTETSSALIVHLTAGWLGADPAKQWTEPDLSGVLGFNVSWGAIAGAPINWQILGWDALTNLPTFPQSLEGLPAAPAEGTTYTIVQRTGGLTP